jgi:MFS family permease
VKTSLGLLREHDFRQLFLADVISQVGTQLTLLALPLVAILALSANPLEIGVLAACETAAFVLVGLPAGAWVDRLRRRNVLIAGDLARAVLLASVPLAWWTGVLTMPQLYAAALLTGLCTVFFDVAYQSYLPHLVGRDNLVEGNSKLEAVRGVSQVGGPTLAGLLIQWLTAPVAVLVDAVSFVASAGFVGLIRKREPIPQRAPDAHLGREIAEGLRFVLGNRLLRSIAMCTGTYNLFSGIGFTMLLVLLADALKIPAGTIGLVMSVGSVGGLIGAFTAMRVAKWLGQGPTIWMSTAFTAPFGLLTALAQPGWLLWLGAVGFGVTMWGCVVYNIAQVSFRQGLTPELLLGRMNATMRFLVWGTMPIGGLLGGLLGEWVGVREAVWIGMAGCCLAFLPTFFSPLRTMRELPRHEEAAVV